MNNKNVSGKHWFCLLQAGFALVGIFCSRYQTKSGRGAIFVQKRGFVSVIQCCGIRQKTRAFMCDAPEGFIFQQIDFLTYCKKCKATVMQVTRLDADGNVSYFRRTNKAARELFDRMRTSIIFKIREPLQLVNNKSSFWLPYNEFGVVKRCYANFSALRPVGESLMLPEKRVLI